MLHTPEQIIADTSLLARKIHDRQPDIKKHVDYFKGRQGKLEFASDKFKQYMKSRFFDFSDNWCAPVAQAPIERIAFQGFKTLDDTIVPVEVEKRWKRNEADRGLNEAALMMTVARRSFGVVGVRSDGTARISFENPDSAAVLYDGLTGDRRVGLIVRNDDVYEYGTLFYPEAVFNVRRKRANLDSQDRLPPSVDGWDFDPDSYQLNTLKAVPLVEFKNQCLLDNLPMSDIEPVESMQDAVNVVWAYLLNALDLASLPARVIMGGDRLEEPVFDEETGDIVGGKPIELDKTVSDRITQITGDAKIGEWTASNLTAFVPVIEKAVQHIAAETRTPGHYLLTNSEVPATGYEIAEAGLVSKTIDRISYLSGGVRELNRLAALSEGDVATAKLLRDAQPVFRSPQYRSQAVMPDGLVKMSQAGFPLQYLCEWFGLSPNEVQRVLKMKQDEANDPEMMEIARSIGAANGLPSDDPSKPEDSGATDARSQAGEKSMEENQS